MERVIVNNYGFYELKNKPEIGQVNEYYEKEYYQKESALYLKKYTERQIEEIRNEVEMMFQPIASRFDIFSNRKCSLLELACGEGWTMDFFCKKGWDVTGIDLSKEGISVHNSHLLQKENVTFIQGDVFEEIKKIKDEKKFDVIWLCNMLEHIPNPDILMEAIKPLLNKNGIVMVRVPNDFSPIQMDLLKKGLIETPYWISEKEHFSYFNVESLNFFVSRIGYQIIDGICTFPIEIFLYNEKTNYIKNPSIGRSCYQAGVSFEDMIHDKDGEELKWNRMLYEMGIGRNIIVYVTKKTEG